MHMSSSKGDQKRVGVSFDITVGFVLQFNTELPRLVRCSPLVVDSKEAIQAKTYRIQLY